MTIWAIKVHKVIAVSPRFPALLGRVSFVLVVFDTVMEPRRVETLPEKFQDIHHMV